MKFKVLEEGCEPYRKYNTDAGYDLKARESVLIFPGGTAKFGSGVCVEIPAGHVGDIRPRSSMSQRGLIIPIGTIDHGYTGEIGLIVINASEESQWVEKGERIAQLVVAPCLIEDIELVDELAETERGCSGFGSTGK